MRSTFRILPLMIMAFTATNALASPAKYVISDYGAVDDSVKVQTEAIQKTIDAAFKAGGGTVVIPDGTYVSGALFFKKGTSLVLEEGATLKGSTDIKDYPDAQVHIEGVIQPYVSALVNAYEVECFSISGKGRIDGSGKPFWEAFRARHKENKNCTNLEVRRPRLIYVSESDNVSIRDIQLRNPGFWTLHLYKCNNVEIKGVSIFAPMKPMRAPSSDGVDLDACNNVHVSGCDISSGDDMIAIKGGKGPTADKDPFNGTNSDILIENCKFGTGPAVLTFGSECVGAKNVILRNCSVNGAQRLLWLKVRPDTPQTYENISVSGISGKVDNVLYIKPWTQFFDLKGHTQIPMTYIRNVSISDCKLECKRECNIVEDSTQFSMENVRLERNCLKFKVNYNPKKIGKYSLEDPLGFADGRKVTSAKEWDERRKEILGIFQREMYGKLPPKSEIYLQELEHGPTLNGKATRRQIRMWFNKKHNGPHIDWLLIVPKAKPASAKGVPAIMCLNYYGNHSITMDKKVLVPDCWLENSDKYRIRGNKACEDGRGIFAEGNFPTIYPVDTLIDLGYAFVTACYGDISPDPDSPDMQSSIGFTGVFDLWRGNGCTATDAPGEIVWKGHRDNTGALMAWAWGLLRGMDMLESLSAGTKDVNTIDPRRVVLTGSSRLGKAALIASAFDKRFAVTVVNQTGGGGAPLCKRNFGENVCSETALFRHWFCKNYEKYAGAEKKMKFDSHLLLSCIAPRPLLIEGFSNKWFDTEGEWLAAEAASCVWEFLCGTGLPKVHFPEYEAEDAVGEKLGYIRRKGSHGIGAEDWKWMLEFSERNLK